MDDDATLHDLRLDVVVRLLRSSSASSVLELGCGAGRLLEKLIAVPDFEQITGVDACGSTVAVAREQLAEMARARLRLIHADYLNDLPGMPVHDAIAMVETIEHLDPGRLSRVESTVFGKLAPSTVVVTTPNREYNALLGLRPGELRDPDHRFEWDRTRFKAWAHGVAARNGFRVAFGGVGPCDPLLGTPTQYAHFSRQAA